MPRKATRTWLLIADGRQSDGIRTRGVRGLSHRRGHGALDRSAEEPRDFGGQARPYLRIGGRRTSCQGKPNRPEPASEAGIREDGHRRATASDAGPALRPPDPGGAAGVPLAICAENCPRTLKTRLQGRSDRILPTCPNTSCPRISKTSSIAQRDRSSTRAARGQDLFHCASVTDRRSRRLAGQAAGSVISCCC